MSSNVAAPKRVTQTGEFEYFCETVDVRFGILFFLIAFFEDDGPLWGPYITWLALPPEEVWMQHNIHIFTEVSYASLHTNTFY